MAQPHSLNPKIAIVGAGGFGRELYWQMKDHNPDAEIEFFADDQFADGDKVLPISSLIASQYTVFIAIGDPKARTEMVMKLPAYTKYGTFIHRSVQIFDKKTIKIGAGTIICAGCILTTNIIIGKHCHFNLNTTVGHDARIGNFVTTAPQVAISGNVKVDNKVYFGTHSSIREKVSIGPANTIGMQAAVVSDIEGSGGIYTGVPAKKRRI